MKFTLKAPRQLKTRFLLSICIPTYNRSAYLKRTIDSIVSQASFQNGSLVEIVVSDNNSQDSTLDICQHFSQLYPKSFVYHRQDTQVQPDINFKDVLNLASGSFLRLNNDTLIHNEYSLEFILSILSIYSLAPRKKITPYFSNDLISNIQSSVLCVSMNDFLILTSGISTYIGAFGVWREDFHRLQNTGPELAWKSCLGHVDCLFRMLELGRPFVIYNKKIAYIDKPVNHGGYDVGKVFVDEYLRLCRRSFLRGHINSKVFFREIRRSILFASSWFNNQLLYPDLYNFQFDLLSHRIRAACLGRPHLLLLFFFHQRFDFLQKFIRKFAKSRIQFLFLQFNFPKVLPKKIASPTNLV